MSLIRDGLYGPGGFRKISPEQYEVEEQGPTTRWKSNGSVEVVYPPGFNPFSENRRKLIYTKYGEIVPIYEYERRNWDMRLDYWDKYREHPPHWML